MSGEAAIAGRWSRGISIIAGVRRNKKITAAAQVMGMRTLALGVNLCTGLLTAAALGPAGRGVQAALITGPQFLALTFALGLHAALIYKMRDDPEHEGDYLGWAIVVAFLAGVVATIAGWIVLPHWLHQYDAQTIANARLLLLVAPINIVAPLFGGALEARGHFALANRSLYLNSLCVLAGLLLLWATGTLTPPAAAACYLLPSLVVFGYLAVCVWPMVRPRLVRARQFVPTLMHYGLRFYCYDLLGNASGFIDQLVIVAFLQPSAVGIYAVAWSLSRVLQIIQGAVNTVLFPSIAGRSAKSVVDIIGITARVMTALTFSGVVVGGLVGPWLLRMLYGAGFVGGVNVFRLLLVEAMLASVTRVLYNAFSGTGRPGVIAVFEGSGMIVSLIIMLVMVPHFGILGAALAVLIGTGTRLVVTMAAMPKILHIPIPRLILSRADLRWISGDRRESHA